MVLIVSVVFLTGCDLALLCDKKGYGYDTEIKTERLSYGEFDQLESLLLDNGFSLWLPERGAIWRKYKNDTYKTYSKRINEKPFYDVDALIYYVRDDPNEVMHHVEVQVGNIYRGAVNPEIKAEIDRYSNLIYEHLTKTVKGAVIRDHKFLTPPMCG